MEIEAAGLLTSASEDAGTGVIAETADDGGGKGDGGRESNLVISGSTMERAVPRPPRRRLLAGAIGLDPPRARWNSTSSLLSMLMLTSTSPSSSGGEGSATISPIVLGRLDLIGESCWL